MAMFGSKEGQRETAEVGGSSNTVIGKSTELEGNLSTQGNVRLEGSIKGDLISRAKVVLAPASHLTGEIKATNAEIAGTVEGKLEVSEMLVLKPSAVIRGDIFCNKLIMEAGAQFNGKVQMGQAANSTAKAVNKEGKTHGKA